MEQSGNTRREFVKGTAAAGVAAAVAGMGFNRMASAAEHENVITQTASFKFNPDKKDEAVEALQELANAVKENEPGVLAYIPHLHENDDTHEVVFFEVYKDAEALQKHGQQPHLAKIRPLFASGVFVPPLEIKRLERVGGFTR